MSQRPFMAPAGRQGEPLTEPWVRHTPSMAPSTLMRQLEPASHCAKALQGMPTVLVVTQKPEVAQVRPMSQAEAPVRQREPATEPCAPAGAHLRARVAADAGRGPAGSQRCVRPSTRQAPPMATGAAPGC
jgi:hypothetical protein